MAPQRKISSAWFRDCEELLRAGQVRQAARKIRALPPSRVSAEQRLAVATLARRAGLLRFALRLLPRPSATGWPRNLRAPEAAEYATTLTLLGGASEALRILRAIQAPATAATLLAEAWCHFEQWNYADAVPLLERYVRLERDPYRRRAGRVNLGEALVFSHQPEKAARILAACITEAAAHGDGRLLANALHVRAQLYASRGERERSSEDLRRARSVFGAAGTPDALLLHRQEAFNEAFRTQSPRPIRRFRERAEAAGAWESVRECDLQLLRLRHQPALFRRVYFGTPYPAYRRRILAELGVSAPGDHVIGGKKGAPLLDLATGLLHAPHPTRVPPQILFTVDALLRDPYVLPTTYGLFQALFPEDYYDSLSSPVRVRQAVKRARRFFATHAIPLEIRRHGGRYALRFTGEFAVRMPAESREVPGRESALTRLREFFPEGFSAREARARLDRPKATLTREFAAAVERGELGKTGKGRATRYKFLEIGY